MNKTENQARFSAEYLLQLRVAITTYPKEYGFSVNEAETVAGKMLAAVARGSFGKDGRAFKATCKALGIPYTYAGINAFWAAVGKRWPTEAELQAESDALEAARSGPHTKGEAIGVPHPLPTAKGVLMPIRLE